MKQGAVHKRMLRSESFLLELMLLFLCFALCSAAALSLFVQADTISRKNACRERAVILLENEAETLQTLSYEDLSMGERKIYMDINWNETTEDNCHFLLIKHYVNQNGLVTLTMSITQNKEQLFTLETKKFFPEGAV